MTSTEQDMQTDQPKDELLPCPFCGGGVTTLDERRLNNMPRMDGNHSPVISVTVRHWCPTPEGQPSGLNITMHGRNRESAIAAWNTRSPAHAGMKEALQRIACGFVPNASTLAINGDWRGLYEGLQALARAALRAEGK